MSQPVQQDAYATDDRSELLPFVPRWATTVLDVGCAHGAFARSLRTVMPPGVRIVGVEPVASATRAASKNEALDQVIEGYFPEALSPDTSFDLICFNDILEHVVDPWRTLASAAQFLTPRGQILASIPNVQFIPVQVNLARGRWDYTETGPLDRTHVRFFTKSSIEGLFRQTGYEVLSISGINPVGRGLQARHPGLISTGLSWGQRLLGNSAFMQFAVVAARRPGE